MDYERTKIRNIIGNNPFRVKNYVAGADIDNSLVPKKLLKPKSNNFNNDEDFIENYLIEKRKEEEIERKRIEKEDVVKKIKKGVAAKFNKLLKKGTYGKSPSASPDSNKETSPTNTKAMELKDKLFNMIVKER